MEPRVMAEEVDPEGSGFVVSSSEEGVSTSCVSPPAGPGLPIPFAHSAVLHQRILLSHVQEDSWH